MSFNEKIKIYENLKGKDIEKLQVKLNDNLEKSKDDLINCLIFRMGKIDYEISYLINELLEDKEHVDAFKAIHYRLT